MEKNEKIEKPAWVEIIESLPEIIRQPIGNTCVGVINSLVQLWFMNPNLYDEVRNEADRIVFEYCSDLEKRSNSPE